MKCTWLNLGDGTVAVVCTRGTRRNEPCQVANCTNPHVVLCDGAVKRSRPHDRTCPARGSVAEAQLELQGAATQPRPACDCPTNLCSMKLCLQHRKEIPTKGDYCPTHYQRWLDNPMGA